LYALVALRICSEIAGGYSSREGDLNREADAAHLLSREEFFQALLIASGEQPSDDLEDAGILRAVEQIVLQGTPCAFLHRLMIEEQGVPTLPLERLGQRLAREGFGLLGIDEEVDAHGFIPRIAGTGG
jgi:hypothetical protein